MNTTRFLSALVLVTLLGADGLSAQRRGTSGGSSSGGGRSTPSGGGSSSGGSRGSSGSPNRGGTVATSRNGGSGSTSSGSGGSSSAGGRRGESGGGTQTEGAKSSGSGTSGTTSQSGTRRAGGKIGAIKAQADRANARARGGVVYGRGIYIGNCWSCDYWGYYGDRWGRYHGGYWYPSHRDATRGDSDEPQAGQGYDEYPYAGGDTSGFVRPHVFERRSYGVVTGQFFSDAGSTARAGRFGIEGARGLWRGELDYAYTAEPVSGGTDRMHDFRIAGGIQPRLGAHAYLTATVGLRAIAIPGGRSAGGLEGGLGVQLLPRRPFGVNITGRAAAMSWNGQDYFALRELNTTGSIFVNRMELQAGWHWLKVGSSPAFGGPVAGLRIWF